MKIKICDSPRGPIYYVTEGYCKDCEMYEPISLGRVKKDKDGNVKCGEHYPLEDGITIMCTHHSVCKYVADEVNKRLNSKLERLASDLRKELDA